MATRRNTTTRKAPVADVTVDDMPSVDDVTTEGCEIETPPPATKRRYLSHENCDHDRKGDAGKIARAKCRKALREMVAAASEEVAVAV
jgi:hypothetical protein